MFIINLPVCIVFIVVNNVPSSEYNVLNKLSYYIMKNHVCKNNCMQSHGK